MALPEIVTREEWLAARRTLLTKEKELTRARDALNAERRRLPMVEVTEDYRFTGPDGDVGLLDLFEGRRQLVVHHFMWNVDLDEDGVEHPRDVGCPSCSATADDIAHLEHLHAADTTLAAVTRAPFGKIAAFRERMGWTFPWYSSEGSRFNYDFWATVDDRVAPVLLNFRDEAELLAAGVDWGPHRRGDHPGVSAFLRDGRSGVPHVVGVRPCPRGHRHDPGLPRPHRPGSPGGVGGAGRAGRGTRSERGRARPAVPRRVPARRRCPRHPTPMRVSADDPTAVGAQARGPGRRARLLRPRGGQLRAPDDHDRRRGRPDPAVAQGRHGLFADGVAGRGPVLDVGCGPGQVTAYLVERGVDASGVDLSPRMIEHARRLYPHCTFAAASATELELAESSLAGVMGWWSLFNLPRDVLPQVLASFARALMPGGLLIVATHVGGDDLVRTEAYGGVPVSWTTHRWQPEQLTTLIEQAGLRPVAEVRLHPDGDQLQGPGVVVVARRDG